MNLYSINTTKQGLSFSPLIYSIRKSDYSESLILTYNDTDDNMHQEILESNRSMLSNWMEILDYDTEDKETLGKTFDLLLSSVHPFEIQPNMQNDNLETHIDNFINSFKSSVFSDTTSSVLDILKECKVPNDTPLMEQLKKLHDEYAEKYENTHKKDREAVWKEYIQKNKELLG